MVKCTRAVCPPLDCDETLAVRRSGCCKMCPTRSSAVPGDPSWLGDQQVTVIRSKSEVLAAGGCTHTVGRLYENGEEWHPRIASQGEVKSVKCHCKVGCCTAYYLSHFFHPMFDKIGILGVKF